MKSKEVSIWMPINQFRYAYRTKFRDLRLPFIISACLAAFGCFTLIRFSCIDGEYLCMCDNEFWAGEGMEVLWHKYPFLCFIDSLFGKILYIKEIGKYAYISVQYWPFLIYFVLIVFLLWLFDRMGSVVVLWKTQDIESPIEEGDYLRIRNKEGKLGLCEVLPRRIVSLLPFSYTEISPLDQNQKAFVCRIDKKCGLYHAGAKKMILPVEYDQIEYWVEDTVLTTRNGHQELFSIKGPKKINVK